VRAQVLVCSPTCKAKHNLSYLFVSHDLSVVRELPTVVLVMRRGEIVEAARPKRVFRSPVTLYQGADRPPHERSRIVGTHGEQNAG